MKIRNLVECFGKGTNLKQKPTHWTFSIFNVDPDRLIGTLTERLWLQTYLRIKSLFFLPSWCDEDSGRS